MKNSKGMQKLIAVFLVIVMIFGFLPTNTMAVEGQTLTVRFDGEELIGYNLQAIAEAYSKDKLAVKKFEIVSGKFTDKDGNYLFNTLVGTNTNEGVSVIFENNPELDVAEAFPNGINYSKNKLFRLEFPGLKKINTLYQQGKDGSSVPVLYAPDLETIECGVFSGSFKNSGITTLYLPNIKKIGKNAFSAFLNTATKHIILPGEKPEIDPKAFSTMGGANQSSETLWVPEDKLNEYIGLPSGCSVRALPDGVTTLEGLAEWVVSRLPDDPSKLKEADIENVFLAYDFTCALPLASLETMSAEVKKAKDAYLALPSTLITDFKAMVDSLPASKDVKLEHEMQILEAWSAAENFPSAFKNLLAENQETLDKLNAVYNSLMDVKLKWHIQNATPMVAVYQNDIGDKRLVTGNNYEEMLKKYNKTYKSFTTAAGGTVKFIITSSNVVYGDYKADNFNTLFGYNKSIKAEAGVRINGGTVLLRDSFPKIAQQAKAVMDLPFVTAIEDRAFYTFGVLNPNTAMLTLNIPNVKTIGETVYYHRDYNELPIKYTAFMPKLIESQSMMRSEAPLALPALINGAGVYKKSTEEYAFLPSLTSAGKDMFSATTNMKAVWLPKAKSIDASAFNGSSAAEIYLGSTPPTVLNGNMFIGVVENRTVYVPDNAVNLYKALDDGNTGDNLWFGWKIKKISEATTGAALLNNYINALPEEVGNEYIEWLGDLDEARKSLNDTSSINNEKLDAAIEKATIGLKEEINRVINLIDAIGDASKLTIERRADVEAARAAYDKLVRVARIQVTNRQKLFDAEVKMKKLLIDDIIYRISKLPDRITQADIALIRSIYSDYLSLTEEEKKQIGISYNRLNAAIDEVINIESDMFKAEVVTDRILRLPSIDRITLSYETEILNIKTTYDRLSTRAQGFVDAKVLDKLIYAEGKIEKLKTQGNNKTVYVAVEKFTLGQGYVCTPIPLTITKEKYKNVAAIILDVLGEGNYSNSGSIESSFYLQSIKDNDRSKVQIPKYILDKIALGKEKVKDRSMQDWLTEMDYTSMSGWMYTVGNVTPSGASNYSYDMLKDGDVIRFQFTVYGHGADLGYDSISGGNKFYEVANKDELTAQIAIVDASPEKNAWLQDRDYALAYEEAYKVIESMLSAQEEVDACVIKLKNTPAIGGLQTVTVTVRDMALRRHLQANSLDDVMTYENLTELGNYQQPFGNIITDEKVTISAGMSAKDAVIKALENAGYIVDANFGMIIGIGPLATPDRKATVKWLLSGDAGNRSKWVLDVNGYAIANSESADDFIARSGDKLLLKYSVDGGYDIGCFPNTETHFTIGFNPDIRVFGDGNERDIFILPGSKDIKINYTREGPALRLNDYNRYHKIGIESMGASYANGQNIPISEGQLITVTVKNPIGTGGKVLSNFTAGAIQSGNEEKVIFKVKYLMTPAKLEMAINALPEISALDYDLHNELIIELMKQYNAFNEKEKGELSDAAKTKLLAANSKIEEIIEADKQMVDALVYAVNGYYGKITQKNYEQYVDAVNSSIETYEKFNDRCKRLFEETTAFKRMNDSKLLIDRYVMGSGSIGIPTDYPDDFMISANAFNLTLGEAWDKYEVAFREYWSGRGGEKGLPWHTPGLLTFDIKDPGIFEIREVPDKYVDKGLGGGETYDTIKYYLIPKKAGTTTFTVTINSEKGQYLGQLPVMAVHVNNPVEGTVKDLADKLTNINSLPRTTKYDTFHYFFGQKGAEFSFKVNGTEPEVYVYNYLEYEKDGTPVKTKYVPDENGNVTILLKDGYNPIEVTATYEGQRVTQVYGLKGKIINYELSNLTTPGATTYKKGDTVSLKITGLATPIQKILRIYNPSMTTFCYDTDMPRQSVLLSGGGQYAAGEMQFLLTGAGKVTLTNGRVCQGWFGSSLYSETAQGNVGGIAPQTEYEFSYLPDITLMVEENLDYNPNCIVPTVQGGSTVRAGETVTITIPDLDTSLIEKSYPATGMNAFLKAVTIFTTNILGVEVQSKEVVQLSRLSEIKTITITIPDNVPEGSYRIYGGYVKITHGDPTWLRYNRMFQREISDITLNVTVSKLTQAKIDARDELISYKNPDEYREAQKEELTASIENGKKAIDAAGTEEAVFKALDGAKKIIDAIKTDKQMSIDNVIGLIEALPDSTYIVYKDKNRVDAARAAYDALGEWKSEVPEELIKKLEAAMTCIKRLSNMDYVSAIYTSTDSYIYSRVTNPTVASTGGEWAIIGLARSNCNAGSDYYNKYISNVINVLKKNNGVLHDKKYTEYSRVILGLTSIGYDVTDVAGYNLLKPLADYDKVKWQGINGVIWALIAFDSHGYDIPMLYAENKQTTREKLIKEILDKELSNGGWTLSGDNADIDITAMSIQALSPYYNSNIDVKKAVDRGLLKLSSIQNSKGGFDSWGTCSSESCSQVIVALTSLGINPTADERFIKNENTVIDALCDFYVKGGGLKHIVSGNLDGMATEQGYYALASFYRLINGQNPLYNMMDVKIDAPYMTVIELIDSIGTVTYDKADTIKAARSAYNALSTIKKVFVKNYATLIEAEAKLLKLIDSMNDAKDSGNSIKVVKNKNNDVLEKETVSNSSTETKKESELTLEDDKTTNEEKTNTPIILKRASVMWPWIIVIGIGSAAIVIILLVKSNKLKFRKK